MISIIIVTFNSEEFIKECIDSIYNQTKRSEFEILLIDNNSSDNTIKIVYKEFPDVRIIRNTKNTGFASANNKGIKRAYGDYLLFLNPDTYLVNDALSVMKEFLQKNRMSGCAGARLEYYNDKFQLSCRKFPNVINVFFGRKSVFRHFFPRNPISRDYMMENLDYSKIQEVDWVMGAAMMIKMDVLKEIGLFDERYFLFVEDTDLCYRMRREGYLIHYLPEAIIKHYHGGSVRKKFNVSQMYHNLSMYKFFKKYNFKNKPLELFLYMGIIIRLLSVFIVDNIIRAYRSFSPSKQFLKRNCK